MKTSMMISVVTPLHNGESFVAKAYACLSAQSHEEWEWVVVDDGSTDGSLNAMMDIASRDSRVRVFSQKASGSAKLPRDHAVYEAKGELILPLDIDDEIEPDYLKKQLDRMVAADADIVYPCMQFRDSSTGELTRQLPESDFDITAVYEGRQLIRETMPEWRIGCNGGLYRRDVWVRMSYPGRHEPIWMYSDEVDERHYLLKARRVAFSDAVYTYWVHQASVTRKPSPKLFHPLPANIEILDFCEREFGADSEEARLAGRKLFFAWRSLVAFYARNYKEYTDAEGPILTHLHNAFNRINLRSLTQKERIQFLWMCNYQLLFALMCLKYSPRCFVEKMFQRIASTAYRWTIIRRRTEKEIRKNVANCPKLLPDGSSAVVSLSSDGGLIDRLRGAVSTFMVCREAGVDFRLKFDSPFELSDYLEPNEYDWRLSSSDETVSDTKPKVSQCHTTVIDTQTSTLREREWQHRHLLGAIRKHRGEEHHVCTNAAFCYDQDFARVFHQLFKPSARLSEKIENLKKEWGGGYITVSARLCNLLGDFNEETYSEPLQLNEQDKLLEDCVAIVRRLRSKNSEAAIIICSDSTTLIDKACEIEGVTTIQGTVSHVGNDKKHDYEYYEKTFLDFLAIAGAAESYLILGRGLYSSGFPYAAALLDGRELNKLYI